MQTQTKKRRIWLRVLCIVLAVIVLAVGCLGIAFAWVWADEISTVNSFTHLRARNDENEEGSVYSMEVQGDFYFDKFLWRHSKPRRHAPAWSSTSS